MSNIVCTIRHYSRDKRDHLPDAAPHDSAGCSVRPNRTLSRASRIRIHSPTHTACMHACVSVCRLYIPAHRVIRRGPNYTLRQCVYANTADPGNDGYRPHEPVASRCATFAVARTRIVWPFRSCFIVMLPPTVVHIGMRVSVCWPRDIVRTTLRSYTLIRAFTSR